MDLSVSTSSDNCIMKQSYVRREKSYDRCLPLNSINPKSIRISSTNSIEQIPIVDFIEHYRNIYANPESFVKRRVDYGKMRVFDDRYRKELERFKSFDKFPVHLKHLIKPLSKSGFYYIGTEKEADKVKCIFCQGILQNWKKTSNPKVEHKTFFPTCPFLLNLNVSNEQIQEDFTEFSKEDPDLSNVTEEIPYVITKNELDFSILFCEDMANIEMREETFSRHPQLVKFSICGLFVVTKNDSCYLKCHECKKELIILNGVIDLPESVFHEKNCSYVNNQHHTLMLKPKNRFCSIEYSITTKEIEARMESRNIQQFSKFVVGKCNIEKIIEMRLKQRGIDYSSLFEFLKDIKNFEIEESEKSLDVNDFLLADFTCVVCLDKPVAVVFLPCGHMKSCLECSKELSNCPFCRKVVERTVRRVQFVNCKLFNNTI